MRTFENWLQEATTGDLKAMGATPAQIAKLKQRREKRGFGFDRGDDRAGKTTPTTKPKALPAAADKGSAIVRQKQGGTGKEAIGGNKKKSGPGVRVPDPNKGSKTYDRINKGGALAKRTTGGDDFGKPVGGDWSAGKTPRMDPKKKFDKRGAGIKSTLGKAAGAVGNQARGTMQDKGEKMQDAKVTPVKRGLYNP